MFPSHFQAQTFQVSFLVWFQLELERHTRCLRSQPKFHRSLWASGKLNPLIESQHVHKMRFSIGIIDLEHLANIDLPVIPCCLMVIYIKNKAAWFSGILTAFSGPIGGFLFRCKSIIFQPSYAVSGLKDVPKQFWQK